MAAARPGSVEQAELQGFGAVQAEEPFEDLDSIENTLIAMENMDRSSPEMWPEKSFPGVTDFINMYNTTQPTNNNNNKLPYSKELSQEDQNYLHQLASLSTAGLISKVKELHDIAYQLGVEESKEVTRGKYLNLFNRKKNEK